MVGDIAHICNRGVDKRKIFNSRQDYIRFLDSLFLLNNISGKLRTRHQNIFDSLDKLPDREKLVEIFKWSLMPNHFHLLLYENVDGGILEFTKRLGNSYTKYFNLKNNGRSGYLFQNSSKIVQIKTNEHFLYIPIYIDLNPLELSTNRSIDFLTNYEWSSFADYFGKKKYADLVNRETFYELFDRKPDEYYREINGFLKDSRKLDELESVNLAG